VNPKKGTSETNPEAKKQQEKGSRVLDGGGKTWEMGLSGRGVGGKTKE